MLSCQEFLFGGYLQRLVHVTLISINITHKTFRHFSGHVKKKNYVACVGNSSKKAASDFLSFNSKNYQQTNITMQKAAAISEFVKNMWLPTMPRFIFKVSPTTKDCPLTRAETSLDAKHFQQQPMFEESARTGLFKAISKNCHRLALLSQLANTVHFHLHVLSY